jgi:hypothetical protein
MWDCDGADRYLVWWEVSEPRKQSPPPQIYSWLAMPIKLKQDVSCPVSIHYYVPSDLVSRFNVLPKLLQEFVLWHLIPPPPKKKPFRQETSVNECGL